MKKIYGFLVVLFTLSFASMGFADGYVDIIEEPEASVYRVTNIGDINGVANSFNYSILERCERGTRTDTVTTYKDDHTFDGDVLVTTESVTVTILQNCTPVAVPVHGTSKGWLVGFGDKAIPSLATVGTGYFVGEGISNSGDRNSSETNIDSSNRNSNRNSNWNYNKNSNRNNFHAGGGEGGSHPGCGNSGNC